MEDEMIWVGLTGGIASGKSTAAQMLREMGYAVVDADDLARRVVAPGKAGFQKLRDILGPSFFTPEGELKRAELAAYIFSNPEARIRVEQLLHPQIQIEMLKEKQRLIEQGVEMAFYDVPLLFEKQLQDRFDGTLLIYASEEMQRERLKKRESWSDDEIDGRFAAQLPIEEKKTLADFVIDNTGSLDDLRKNLSKVAEQMKKDLK